MPSLLRRNPPRKRATSARRKSAVLPSGASQTRLPRSRPQANRSRDHSADTAGAVRDARRARPEHYLAETFTDRDAEPGVYHAGVSFVDAVATAVPFVKAPPDGVSVALHTCGVVLQVNAVGAVVSLLRC